MISLEGSKMRVEDRADDSVSPVQLPYSALSYPSVWMYENGPYQFPHLQFYPIENDAVALFAFEYNRDGSFNFGSVTFPEERTDIPPDKFSLQRYDSYFTRFSLSKDQKKVFWVVDNPSNPDLYDPIPTSVPTGGTFRYRWTAYKIDHVQDSSEMNLYVRRIAPRDELVLTNPIPSRIFDRPVNLPFPLRIEDTDLVWLTDNRKKLNSAQFQHEATERLHFMPTFPTVP